MIARARLLVLCAILFSALPVSAYAQTQAPFRIYAITFRGMTEVEQGFEDHFKARGIPVSITYRDLARDASRMPGFIEEIRRTRPDLVYTWGTSVTLGVVGRYDDPKRERFIDDIPVVFTLVAAPLQAKIVPSLASSRRNVTGVSLIAPLDAQMRAMASYRPFKSVGVLYTPTEQNSVVILKQIKELGAREGFRVIERAFHRNPGGKVVSDGAADMVREIKGEKADWLYLPPDSFLGTLAKKIVIPAANESGLPTFASTEQLMQSGALAGLVSRYHSIGQFTAYKAERILVHRIKPADIPVETLKRFSFQIRLKTAAKLGLEPPLTMFNYAELITTDVDG